MPAFSPLPVTYFTFPRTRVKVLAAFNLSSTNAFDLDQSKILSFGKLKLILLMQFYGQKFRKHVPGHICNSKYSRQSVNKHLFSDNFSGNRFFILKANIVEPLAKMEALLEDKLDMI